MTDFEWEADYAALCSSYGFKVSVGPHGKELRATAEALPGQALLVESPIVVWPVSSSVALEAFTCCENCLRIRPFDVEESQRRQKVRVEFDATTELAANFLENSACVRSCEPAAAEDEQLEACGEEVASVCMEDAEGVSLWFCSRRCHQQAFGVKASELNLVNGEGSGGALMESSTYRKRDACGDIRVSTSNSASSSEETAGGQCSVSQRIYGWQEFLPPKALRMLRRHDEERCMSSIHLQAEEDNEIPIGVEALGRIVARVAATAASLKSMKGWSLQDAYAEACRPFLRLARADATEAHSAFNMNTASVQLQSAVGAGVSSVLGSELTETLLSIDALAFFYGAFMHNAQSLNIWGAANDGTLMVLRAAGVYILQACCNHSCVPNCCVENGMDACITLKAERPIAEGDELTITYIPLTLPQPRRQELLDNYRFVCDCTRCTKEKQILHTHESTS